MIRPPLGALPYVLAIVGTFMGCALSTGGLTVGSGASGGSSGASSVTSGGQGGASMATSSGPSSSSSAGGGEASSTTSTSATSTSATSSSSVSSTSSGVTCSSTQKLCGMSCQPADAMHGCGGMSCTACSFKNATATCDSTGMCAIGACSPGFADCDKDPSNGCEVDTTMDAAHCGSCGKACGTVAHGKAACVAGQCAVGSCDPGWGDCNTTFSDGCEMDVTGDIANCGACGRACKDGANVASAACAMGVCTSTCVPGKANCNMPMAPMGDDGCETDATKVGNCGGCGNACGAGAPTSSPLSCLMASPMTNVTTYVCGCVHDGDCKEAGAGGTCSNGVCTCGGKGCQAGEVCQHGSSGDSCTCHGNPGCGSGQTCCDGMPSCVDILTDVNNCGGCGHVCPPSFNCVDGGCGCGANNMACDAGGGGTCHQLSGPDVCVCNGIQCNIGERCLPGGVCG